MSRLSANSLLLLAAIIWGAAFVAQATAMDTMGPLYFTGIRFLMASVFIVPFVWLEAKKGAKPLPASVWVKSAGVGVVFFIGITTQQYGFLTTSVTNAGFLTALYVVLTPIMGIIIFRKAPAPYIWPIVVIALLGAYLLAGSLETMAIGDILMVISALFWALQIIFVGRLVIDHGYPVTIAWTQFAVVAVLGIAGGAVFEELTVTGLQNTMLELVYTGVLSSGVCFTIQAIAQRYTPAPDAAVLLSSESLFAAIFGALLLGERLTGSQMVGCAMIFSCILLVELLPQAQKWLRRNLPSTSSS